MKEINPHGVKFNGEGRWRLLYLYMVANEIRSAWGYPMIVTSGVRTVTQQMFIYRKINVERIKQGLEEIPVPMNSWHLKAGALDIADPGHGLFNWLTIGEGFALMEELNIYLEHKDFTRGWLHFQVVPPKSGNRVFIPY